MKAAVVRELGRPPRYEEFTEPVPQPGETQVSVVATALSHLAHSRASGTHYSAGGQLPFVPGVDGVGRAPDGTTVYFAFPRTPFGSMAERTVVPAHQLVPVPDRLEPTLAAGAANAGMSCWVPLTRLAHVRPDESVLINGATGIAGQVAVQVAKHLGAHKVVATGRDEAKLRGLRELGADVLIPLGQSTEVLQAAVRQEAREARVGIVLDYLWGRSAEAILTALAGPDAPRGSSRVRYIEVGDVTGRTISIDGSVLRSSGVELLGTGLGSSPDQDLLAGIGQFLEAMSTAKFRFSVEVHPLSEVETLWDQEMGERRLVFTLA